MASENCSYPESSAGLSIDLRTADPKDQFGFCFVEGVPVTPEDTEALIRRIAFIRETQCMVLSTSSTSTLYRSYFGVDGGFWDFTADLRHGDTAYTNLALGAHTDTTYYVCRSPYTLIMLPFLTEQHRLTPVACKYSICSRIQRGKGAHLCWLMVSMQHPSSKS